MNKRTDTLLYLSRISRQAMAHADVDLSEMALAILTGLRASQPDRAVEMVVQPQVVAHADPRLIREVLQNLLGNAWKFTGKTEHARIEFGSLREAPETTYFVKDNGAGFYQQGAGKIYLLFQRRQDKKQFEGLGVGLTVAERVVDRHGGRIWAQGEVGMGANIFFTLGNGTAAGHGAHAHPQPTGPSMGGNPQCPDCGGALRNEGGCAVCWTCGYSACG